MKLLQNSLQLFRDGQAEVCGVLHETDAFIGDVEKDHRCPKYAAGADYMRVQNVTDAYQQEDQIPLKPTSLDSFLSAKAHITPVI